MGAGMAKFIEKEVETCKEFDEYCHYVAGLVGVGLSKVGPALLSVAVAVTPLPGVGKPLRDGVPCAHQKQLHSSLCPCVRCHAVPEPACHVSSFHACISRLKTLHALLCWSKALQPKPAADDGQQRAGGATLQRQGGAEQPHGPLPPGAYTAFALCQLL